MKIRLDADLFSVLKVCARVYHARQLMRFGPGKWTKYFENPYVARPISFCCCGEQLPTGDPYKPRTVWPEPSAMQGHWE